MGLAATFSLGLPALWLAVAAYLEAGRPEQATELTRTHVADQSAIAVGAQWEAEARIRRRRSPDTEPGQPEHEEQPEPPPRVGEDLRGLDDDQVQLLRSGAVALRNLLMVIGEAERTPLLSQQEFAEVSARLQGELNRAEAQLHALKGAVTLLTWPDREWAAEFTAERDTVERELQAAKRRNASGASNQRQPWPRESVARLLGLLQRYSSLFTAEQ